MSNKEPGVYLNMPMADYHADPAIGGTAIKSILVSDEEYWSGTPANLDRLQEDENHFKVGRMYHYMVLEPEKPFPFEIKAKVKSTKEEGKIGGGDYYELGLMLKRLMGNPLHWNLLHGDDCIVEASLFWRDAETGLMMKCRPDAFKPDYVSDLKTSKDISPKDMFYTFPRYHYHVSGYRYSMGMLALKEMIRNGYQMPPEFSKEFVERFMSYDKQHFCFVFQDKNAPYSTRALAMTPWASEQGSIIYNTALSRLKNYYDNPKYSGGAQPVSYSGIENIDEGDFYVSNKF